MTGFDCFLTNRRVSFDSCSKRYIMTVGCRRSERTAMVYGLGVLRIERSGENGFNVEEAAKKKKRLIGRG